MGRPKRATDGSHGYIGFSDQACSSWPSEIPRSQKAYTVELRHSWIQHSRFIKCDLLRHSRFVYSWFLFFNTSRTGLPYPQRPILIQPENCSTEIKILCPETLPVSTHTSPSQTKLIRNCLFCTWKGGSVSGNPRLILQLEGKASAHVSEKPFSAAFALPLSALFTLLFTTAHLPSAWKSANITAWNKKGANILHHSLNTVHMKCFVSFTNLVSVHEMGWRPHHSTLDTLLKLSKQWMETMRSGICLWRFCHGQKYWHPCTFFK